MKLKRIHKGSEEKRGREERRGSSDSGRRNSSGSLSREICVRCAMKGHRGDDCYRYRYRCDTRCDNCGFYQKVEYCNRYQSRYVSTARNFSKSPSKVFIAKNTEILPLTDNIGQTTEQSENFFTLKN